jgi:hypothetical protein
VELSTLDAVHHTEQALAPLTVLVPLPRSDRQVYERDLDRLYTLNKDERDAAVSTQVRLEQRRQQPT